MEPDLDIEILEVMERHNITYDEALERYQRKRRQIELAGDRHKAQSIKKVINKGKQKQFRDAAQDLDCQD